MPMAGTLLGHHVYVMIPVNIVFLHVFSCLAVMITPHGKQDRYAPPGIPKPGKVCGLLSDMQLVRCKLWSKIVSYTMLTARSLFSFTQYIFISS